MKTLIMEVQCDDEYVESPDFAFIKITPEFEKILSNLKLAYHRANKATETPIVRVTARCSCSFLKDLTEEQEESYRKIINDKEQLFFEIEDFEVNDDQIASTEIGFIEVDDFEYRFTAFIKNTHIKLYTAWIPL